VRNLTSVIVLIESDQRVAMKIGDEYDIPLIGFSEWQALASACAVDSGLLMNRLRELADALPDAVSAARDQALADGPRLTNLTLSCAIHGVYPELLTNPPASAK
jgi:hypothetical protein